VGVEPIPFEAHGNSPTDFQNRLSYALNLQPIFSISVTNIISILGIMGMEDKLATPKI